jgi:hypothetical protein
MNAFYKDIAHIIVDERVNSQLKKCSVFTENSLASSLLCFLSSRSATVHSSELSKPSFSLNVMGRGFARGKDLFIIGFTAEKYTSKYGIQKDI